MKMKKPENVDQYISGYPTNIQHHLREIRSTIKKAAPQAQEVIKYDMPAFTLNGNLVYFAAFNNHIGFYPVPAGDKAFEKEIAIYKKSKGALQFPLEEPIPLNLIAKLVKLRVQENLEKTRIKGLLQKIK